MKFITQVTEMEIEEQKIAENNAFKKHALKAATTQTLYLNSSPSLN